MSHLKERKEKICLNCNTDLVGRYCHVCGQENLEPKETVWHLVTHFFNDITHFDGKFFETVKLLLRKPGFLSLQYMSGRRASFLNPIRMYVFTSAIFFIILFSLKGTKDIMKANVNEDRRGIVELEQFKLRQDTILTTTKDQEEREIATNRKAKATLRIAAIKHVYGDSTVRKFDDMELDEVVIQHLTDSLLQPNITPAAKDLLRKKIEEKRKGYGDVSFFGMSQGQYHSVAEYDSSERKLPDSLRDGWLKRVIMRKVINLGEAWHEDKKAFAEHLMENIFHSFPKILFITLPLFALMLNILYYRHKQYFYVDHGIFTIHVYCATFILLMIHMLWTWISDLVGLKWFDWIYYIVDFAIWFYIIIYLYKAMRGFYHQRRGKTFLKYFITLFTSFIINCILFVLFVLISVVSLA